MALTTHSTIYLNKGNMKMRFDGQNNNQGNLIPEGLGLGSIL